MAEILISLFIGFLSGLYAARRAKQQALLAVSSKLDKAEALNRRRERQLKAYKRCQLIYQDIWIDMSTRLGLSKPRGELLELLGGLLVEMKVPENANASLVNNPNQQALSARYSEINNLVHAINDELLREMWTTCSYVSLHHMVHLLATESSVAANSSNFSALDKSSRSVKRVA